MDDIKELLLLYLENTHPDPQMALDQAKGNLSGLLAVLGSGVVPAEQDHSIPIAVADEHYVAVELDNSGYAIGYELHELPIACISSQQHFTERSATPFAGLLADNGLLWGGGRTLEEAMNNALWRINFVDVDEYKPEHLITVADNLASRSDIMPLQLQLDNAVKGAIRPGYVPGRLKVVPISEEALHQCQLSDDPIPVLPVTTDVKYTSENKIESEQGLVFAHDDGALKNVNKCHTLLRNEAERYFSQPESVDHRTIINQIIGTAQSLGQSVIVIKAGQRTVDDLHERIAQSYKFYPDMSYAAVTNPDIKNLLYTLETGDLTPINQTNNPIFLGYIDGSLLINAQRLVDEATLAFYQYQSCISPIFQAAKIITESHTDRDSEKTEYPGRFVYEVYTDGSVYLPEICLEWRYRDSEFQMEQSKAGHLIFTGKIDHSHGVDIIKCFNAICLDELRVTYTPESERGFDT